MRPSTLLWLWWLRLRARWASELLAAVGIAAGVALLFAALIANASMTGSVDALTRGVVGNAQLQLIARGPDGMPESLADRASRLDAIRAAAPVIEHRVGIVGPEGRAWVTLLGGDTRFAAMSGGTLQQLADPELIRLRAIGLPSPIAAAIGLQPYSRVAVESRTGLTELLGVSMGAREIGLLADTPVALTTLPVAQDIAGMPGHVSRIFLQARPGQEATAREQAEALAGTTADVRPGDWDASVFRTAAGPTQQSTTMFAVLAAGVGFLFATCAVLLTANRRIEFCRQLRMDGHPPSTVRAAMLLDAAALGLLGAIAGLLAGDQLSRHVLDAVPGYLTTGFPIGATRTVTPAAVAIAVLGALTASIAAVLLPLRQTLFPGSAVRRAVPGGRSAPALGIAAVLVAIAITAWWPTAALAGLIALTIGLLLLLPTVLQAVVMLFTRIARRIPSSAPIYAAWRLSAPSSATISRALAATGALAAFALVAIGGARDDLLRGLDAGAVAIDRNAAIWVTANGPTSAYAVSPFAADELTAALDDVDGITNVEPYYGSWLDIGNRRAWIQAPPADAPAPAPPGQLRDGALGPASAAMRAGGSVILSEAIANELAASVGDTVTLPTPAPLNLRVAAISNNLGWPSGTIILTAADYARAWNTRTPSALLIETHRTARAAEVVDEIRQLVAEHGLPLSVQTADERVDLHRTSAREGLVRLRQITVLLAIAAALAMAAAMGGIILQRRPAIAARKVEGFTTRQMWTSLLLEATVLVGSGCAAGAAAGLLGQVLLSRALETITGFPLAYSAALGVAGQIVGAIVLLALTIITVLGWTAARVPASAQPQTG